MLAARFPRLVAATTAAFLAAATFLPTFAAAQDAPGAASIGKTNKTDKIAQVDAKRPFRGVWVSTVGNIDYPSKPGLSADRLRAEADALLDRAAELRLTAVVLQVRPMGDALYRSKISPASSFVSGKQGVAPDGDFDPLAYWVDGAHRRGLQLHAWVHPYRVTTGAAQRKNLAETNPAVLHPEWTFERDGKVYLNPGIAEVRRLVIAGMVEIVENYDVDGIHIDDYFYPARDMTEDLETFRRFPRDFHDVEDWRRDNVDILIRDAGKAIRAARPGVVWGVSPAGIWANKSSHPLGSDTRGNQCYFNLYADVRHWVKSEWIDYVTPQIYWHIGFEIAEFKTLVDWWSDVAEGTDVLLVACGEMVRPAKDAAALLKDSGISAGVLDMYCVKPLDREGLLKAAEGKKLIVTVEEHAPFGGLGSMVAQVISANAPKRVLNLALPDTPVITGTSAQVFKHYGLNAEGIATTVKNALEG